MLLGVKRTIRAAQTPPQRSSGGSRLPSPAADPWQLHLPPGRRAAPSIPWGSRILTHLPGGERLRWLPLSVEWSPACGAPTRSRFPSPPCLPSPLTLSPLPAPHPSAVTRGQAALGFDPSAADGSGRRGKGAGQGRGLVLAGTEDNRSPGSGGGWAARQQNLVDLMDLVRRRSATKMLLLLSDPSLSGPSISRLIYTQELNPGSPRFVSRWQEGDWNSPPPTPNSKPAEGPPVCRSHLPSLAVQVSIPPPPPRTPTKGSFCLGTVRGWPVCWSNRRVQLC